MIDQNIAPHFGKMTEQEIINEFKKMVEKAKPTATEKTVKPLCDGISVACAEIARANKDKLHFVFVEAKKAIDELVKYTAKKEADGNQSC